METINGKELITFKSSDTNGKFEFKIIKNGGVQIQVETCIQDDGFSGDYNYFNVDSLELISIRNCINTVLIEKGWHEKVTNRFLLCVNHAYSAKNTLEKAVLNMMKSIDRKCYAGLDVEDIKRGLTNRILDLNKANKRCKPIDVSWYFSGKDWCLFLTGICAFSILTIESEVQSD